jgi:hypothetical protein
MGILHSHVDAIAVSNNPKLLSHIEQAIRTFCPKDLFVISDIKELTKLEPYITIKKRLICSRTHFISEGGGKTRVIAINDYFSQQALLSLHKFLMKVLKCIKTDSAFSHNRGALIAKLATKHGKDIFCFDLSSATDRFPAEMQRDCIGAILGVEESKAWYNLVTDRDYSISGTDYTKTIRYAVGQPMGLLSSWAAFSVTHHAIIQYCAFRLGFRKGTFSKYIIIGDDIAIFDRKVASEYQRLLGRLDIPINLTKTVSSIGFPSSAEFAKRFFLNGEELSPLTPTIISSTKKE